MQVEAHVSSEELKRIERQEKDAGRSKRGVAQVAGNLWGPQAAEAKPRAAHSTRRPLAISRSLVALRSGQWLRP